MPPVKGGNGDVPVNCGSCRFSEKEIGALDVTGTIRRCRRYPPCAQGLVNQRGGVANMTIWPVVQTLDWCGEHEPKAP